ncbi:hypothetical protein ACH3XW_41915 [Acanthocheilonema viteae]
MNLSKKSRILRSYKNQPNISCSIKADNNYYYYLFGLFPGNERWKFGSELWKDEMMGQQLPFCSSLIIVVVVVVVIGVIVYIYLF